METETKRHETPYVYVRGKFIGAYKEVDQFDRLGQLEDMMRGHAAAAGPAGRRPRIVIQAMENGDG